MRVITIEGVIGWDVDGGDIRRQLGAAAGADVKVEISSIGGSVLAGLEIFNRLRNYKGQVHTHILATAASMASYISLAGDVRTAEDNAVFMIHNVRGFGGGDHRELRKRADVFEGLTTLLANEYAKATGLPIAEIRRLMDEETFFFGDEISQAGFVDKIEKGANAISRDDAIAAAKLALEDCVAKMKSAEQPSDELQDVAAMIGDISEFTPAPAANGLDDINNAANQGGNKPQEDSMDLQKLKADHPALYAQVLQEGREAGAKLELSRVKGHLAMAKSSGAVDFAHECIADGKDLGDQEAIAGYMAATLNKGAVAQRDDDNPDGDLDNNDDQDGAAQEKTLLDSVMGLSKKSGAAVNPSQEA